MMTEEHLRKHIELKELAKRLVYLASFNFVLLVAVMVAIVCHVKGVI